jgi:S1-C subfamily serine protease
MFRAQRTFFVACACVVLLLVTATDSNAQLTLVDLTKKVKESVVQIEIETSAGKAAGTGYVVNQSMVVTNQHVIEDASKVELVFPDMTRIQAKGALHVDADRDIAVIAVPTGAKMNPIAISKAYPEQGLDVAAYGNPGGGGFSVSKGIVSAIRDKESLRQVDEGLSVFEGVWIQTDAPISPGNSGGPLVDYTGTVIGMNTWAYTKEGFQGFNFAISCVDILAAIEKAKSAKLIAFADVSPPKPKTSNAPRPDKSTLLGKIVSQIEYAVKQLPDNALPHIESGDIEYAFPTTSVTSIKTGQIARLRGLTTIIQVLDEGILMKLGSTKCMAIHPNLNAAEFRAKFGDRPIFDVLTDDVYLIGKPTAYTTVVGTTSYYYEIFPLNGVVPINQLKSIVEEEYTRREIEAAKAEELRRQAEAQKQATLKKNRYSGAAEKLRRTFVDSTGDFKIDAFAIKMTVFSVTLMTAEDKREIEVPLNKLSRLDRDWLSGKALLIKSGGDKIKEYLLNQE